MQFQKCLVQYASIKVNMIVFNKNNKKKLRKYNIINYVSSIKFQFFFLQIGIFFKFMENYCNSFHMYITKLQFYKFDNLVQFTFEAIFNVPTI